MSWLVLGHTWAPFIEYMGCHWWGTCCASETEGALMPGRAVVSLPLSVDCTAGAVFSISVMSADWSVTEYVVVYMANTYMVCASCHRTPLDCVQYVVGTRDVLSVCLPSRAPVVQLFSPLSLTTRDARRILDIVVPKPVTPHTQGVSMLVHDMANVATPGYLMDVVCAGGGVHTVVYTRGGFQTNDGSSQHTNLHTLVLYLARMNGCYIVSPLIAPVCTGHSCTLLDTWARFRRSLRRWWWGRRVSQLREAMRRARSRKSAGVTEYGGHMAGGVFTIHLSTSQQPLHVHFVANAYYTEDGKRFVTLTRAMRSLTRGYAMVKTKSSSRHIDGHGAMSHALSQVTRCTQRMGAAWLGTAYTVPAPSQRCCVGFWYAGDWHTRGYVMSLLTSAGISFHITLAEDGHYELTDWALALVCRSAWLESLLTMMHISLSR